MPVSRSDVIDAISVLPTTGEVILAMYEAREWRDIADWVHDLQEKLNTYLKYVIGGQINETAEYRGRPVAVELFVRYAPPDQVAKTFARVKEHLDGEHMKFRVFIGTTRDMCLFA